MMPKGVLIDYGGTLVVETRFDVRAGFEAVLDLAAYCPPRLTIERVLQRAKTVSAQVLDRRDEFGIETPWPAFTRLIYDFLGVRFDRTPAALELAFWKASVTTRPMPGARQALSEFHCAGIPMAVVSNCSFGPEVIRYELQKHGLTEYLTFVMVSAEYAVRKPNALLFDTAAARLGIAPKDIWFVGDRQDTDMAGAELAQMKPIWLKHSTGGESVYLTASSWKGIISHFRKASSVPSQFA